MRLLSAGGSVLDVSNPTVEIPDALAQGAPFVLALHPRLEVWLPLLSYQLPGISFEPIADQRGLLLLAGSVPAGLGLPTDGHGLRGLLTVDETDEAAPRHDAALAFRESSRLSDRKPFHATWSGTLLVERAGQHRLELFTDGGGERVVDGKTHRRREAVAEPALAPRRPEPRTGPHAIEVRYTYVRGLGTFELGGSHRAASAR